MPSCIVAVIPLDHEGVKVTLAAAATLQGHPPSVSVGSPLHLHFGVPYDDAYATVERALSEVTDEWRSHVQLPRATS